MRDTTSLSIVSAAQFLQDSIVNLKRTVIELASFFRAASLQTRRSLFTTQSRDRRERSLQCAFHFVTKNRFRRKC
jgi:hypothetical protein